jgi:hypothetical protein
VPERLPPVSVCQTCYQVIVSVIVQQRLLYPKEDYLATPPRNTALAEAEHPHDSSTQSTFSSTPLVETPPVGYFPDVPRFPRRPPTVMTRRCRLNKRDPPLNLWVAPYGGASLVKINEKIGLPLPDQRARGYRASQRYMHSATAFCVLVALRGGALVVETGILLPPMNLQVGREGTPLYGPSLVPRAVGPPFNWLRRAGHNPTTYGSIGPRQ